MTPPEKAQSKVYRPEKVFSLRLVLVLVLSLAAQLALAAMPLLAGGTSTVAGATCPGLLTHALLLPFLPALFMPFLLASGIPWSPTPPQRGSNGPAASSATRRLRAARETTVRTAQALIFLAVSVAVAASIQHFVFGASGEAFAYVILIFSFGSAIAATSLFFLSMGIPSALVHFLVSVLTFLVLCTMFYADIFCPLLSPEWAKRAVDFLVRANPILTISGSIFNLDLLRQPVMYSEICHIGSGAQYRYASWSEVSVWYLATAVVLAALAQAVRRSREHRAEEQKSRRA